jgi:arylsulfatase A-like enzyme
MLGGVRSSFLLAAAVCMLSAPACDTPRPQPDIVLVVLDTVRRDFTGVGLTPRLDRLAAEGTRFSNAWTTAPWTVPAHASIFTGLPPSSHGSTFLSVRLNESVPTVAERLSLAGYATASFFSNPWLSDRATGMLRGFDVRSETPIGGLAQMISPSGDQGGRQSLKEIERWLSLRDEGRPFFLFVNFLEAHLPYDPPSAYRRTHLADLPAGDVVSIQWAHEYNAGIHGGVDWKRIRRLYGGDVHTADRYLGELVDLVDEDTIFVVTSDHGENLGEHGLAEHQFSVHETLLAVPLVIRAPGLLDRGVRSEPIVLTDLYPTLLALAGVADEPLPTGARSLLSSPGPRPGTRPLVAEYAGPGAGLTEMLSQLNPDLDSGRMRRGLRTVRVENLRLTAASDGSVELHDMVRDPLQVRNLAATRTEAVDLLRDLLSPPASRRNGFDEELDAETRRKLESLGYIR